MRGREKMTSNKRTSSWRATAKRAVAITLAAVMIVTVPTPVQAFSFKKAFNSLKNSINNTVKTVKQITDSSSSKTVYNYTELKNFTTSFFAPTDITVKLGADITIPSGQYIYALTHNITMDMNGHTIYSNSADGIYNSSSGHKFNVKNGTFVQNVNTTKSMVYMFSGDATFTKVTFKKSSSATNVTGVRLNGALGKPEATLDNCSLNGLTTGIMIDHLGTVKVNNSTIYNTQGDAVRLENYAATIETNPDNLFQMTGGSIKYFKGNGIAAGAGTKTVLNGVTVTGGTTRNRYGIRAEDGSNVQLNSGTSVKDNVGGNIAVNKNTDASKCPVTIDNVSKGSYSFTIMDKIASGDNNTYTVAKVSNTIPENLGNAYSDISRYMILKEESGSSLAIQNPPTECKTEVELAWQGKSLDTSKDSNYATVSVNGGEEAETGSATTKYAQKVTLSTTNLNPDRYQFEGWEKFVGGESKGIVSKDSTYKVTAVDKEAAFKAVYQYKTYTLDIRTSGKGTVTVSGGTKVSQSGTKYVYYVDDKVTLTATPNDPDTKTDKNNNTVTTTYALKKWSDGLDGANLTREITVKEDATYTAMFNKSGQTQGTMYVGLKEVTGTVPKDAKLLLVFVGKGYENNKITISDSGLGSFPVGITGLPDGSAKLQTCDPQTGDAPSNSHKTNNSINFSEGKSPDYGYIYVNNLTDPTTTNTTCVQVDDRADNFDGCPRGFIREETVNGEKVWLYWCRGGAVQAAGPYMLYSYDQEIKFNMDTVKITKDSAFTPAKDGNTIDDSEIKVTAKGEDGKEYELSNLKFGGESEGLDNQINYAEGDKLINFELDGVTVDYNFPEATVNGEEYTTLTEAIEAANTAAASGGANVEIDIVGPGVDAIDKTKEVDLKNGVSIKGYDGDTVTAAGENATSKIGVDKDGMVRLFDGELEVTPKTDAEASVGVKDAFATTDKTIHVKTDGNGNAYIVPEEADTKLTISPDNNKEHTVEITGTKANVNYGFDKMDEYEGETVKIQKETEYTINLPKKDEEESAPTIKTSKYNTGETVITPSSDNRMPEISSSAEGDKITVGDKTYVTGSLKEGEKTEYRVNPDTDARPNVTLDKGSLGIPKGSTIQVGETIIENTGADENNGNTVQVNADGEIEVPNGGGVSINGVKISVPSATPMNGNTKITLDKNGNPHITTTGDSDVTITVPGKNGEPDKTYTYKAGDYDCELEIGADGVPVLKNGDVKLPAGEVIKDSEGNEYKGNESDTTIMTSPKVYDKDGDGSLIGGGDIGFDLPKDATLDYKPSGEEDYKQFVNPGDGDGFFTMDPTKAAEGPQADSELGIAAGREVSISTGDGTTINVKAPADNKDKIKVDGSTGNITISKTGDKVELDGTIYEATQDDTILNVDESGVSLAKGGTKVSESGISVGGTKVTVPDASKGSVELVRESTQNTDDGSSTTQTKIKVSGNSTFTIASTSDASASATLAPKNKDTDHEYVVNDDGSISVPKGDTIVRKAQGTIKKDVEIKSGDNNSINVKPLGKPDEKNVESGVTSPVNGLIVEIPADGSATIGGKVYNAKNLENGYTSEAGEENQSKLPLQLVLDEKGNVILHDGTVELDKDTDISVYDVNNKLATIKNESKDDEHKIDVTNPGIITMPKAGTTVSMQEEGAAKTTITSTKDDTQLIYSPEISALKKGGVELSKGDQIMVGDTIIKNNSNANEKIKVERIETEKVTGEGDAKTKELVYTGTVTVPKGGSFEASYPGAENNVSFDGNSADENTVFEINEDGNFVMPDNAIATINKGSDKEVTIQTNNGTGDNKVESIPTPDGMFFAIPKGGSITVNGQKYTNTGEDPLILSVNSEGKVVLMQGEVDLSEGSIVYVENEKEGLVPIENKTETGEGESAGSGATIKVSYEGSTPTYDNDDNITGATYPKVDVTMPKDAKVTVGSNEYENVSGKTTGSTGTSTDVKLNLDLTTKNDASSDKNAISGEKITLEEGTIDMGDGSSISIGSGDDKKVISNIGATEEGTSGDDTTSNSIQVGSDGKLKLPTNSGVISKDTDGNETKIQVPEKKADSNDYQAEVDLKKTDGSGSDEKIEIKLTPAGESSGSGSASGSGNTVKINDGTYTSKEDGKNLTLELDKSGKDVTMGGDTENVSLSNNANVKVGDTTVKAGPETDKSIEVKATTPAGSSTTTKVPEIEIPGGGQANIKNPAKDQDMTVSVPEKKNEDGSSANNKQTIKMDPENGQLSTDLKKDDSIVIGGIEYTGTAENSDDTNTITVNGKTGSLVLPSGEGAVVPSVSTKIDATKFDNPNYQYTIPKGSSVSVNGVDYKAPEDADIILSGNKNGNPVIEIPNANGTIQIGDKTYTAGNARSKFYVDNSGNITLVDNGGAVGANSSIKLSGSDAQKVNGVTYRGSADDDCYTVEYGSAGCIVTPEDNTKLTVDIPSGTTVKVGGKGAVDTVNDNGEKITETFDGPIPIKMTGGSGSVTLDKTKSDKTDTAYISANGQADLKLGYTVIGDTKQLSSIEVVPRKSHSSGSSVTETDGRDKLVLDSASITVSGVLAKLDMSNITSKEDIETAIKKALADSKDKNVTASVTEFEKVDATAEQEGKVSGKIVLTINGTSTVIPFSYTLAKLTDSSDQSEKSAKMPLLVKGKSSNGKVKLTWKKVSGATGYEVYASVCDGGKNYKKVTTKALTYTFKNLNNKKSYKFYVRAYKQVDGRKVYLDKSIVIHVAMKDYKCTNAKGIKNVKSEYNFAASKKARIRAITVKEDGSKKLMLHAAGYRYYSTDTSVATVSKSGIITAKAKGSCTIYVVTNNGTYKKVTITVTK